MRLPLRGGGANGGGHVEQKLSPEVAGAEISVGDAELLDPVLARVVGALAARRDISVDRVSDAILLTDAIAERRRAASPTATCGSASARATRASSCASAR